MSGKKVVAATLVLLVSGMLIAYAPRAHAVTAANIASLRVTVVSLKAKVAELRAQLAEIKRRRLAEQPVPVEREAGVAFISEHDWASALELVPRAIQTGQNRYIAPLFVIDRANGAYDFHAIQKVLASLNIQKIYVPQGQRELSAFLGTKGYRVGFVDALVSSGQGIVVSERDFETAAHAARYASLLGVPFSVFDAAKQYAGRQLYCVGAVPLPCAQRYTRGEMENLLAQQIRTNKIVLAHAADTGTKQFEGTAILAPVLAAAKDEHLVFTHTADAKEVSNLIRQSAPRFGITKGFLTVLGSPDSIAAIYITNEKTKQTGTTDSTLFTYVNEDLFPDLAVGRLYAPTLSGLSSYIARDVFYEQLPKSENIKVIRYDYAADPEYGRVSQAVAEALAKLGYPVETQINVTERDAKVRVEDFQNKFFVYYDDHGWYNWLGLWSNELKDIDGANIIANGCSTCMFAEYKNPLLFCLKAITEGAMSYMGMLGGGGATNSEGYTSAIFSGKSLGEAFWKMNNSNVSYALLATQKSIPVPEGAIFFGQRWGLIGDPTLALSPKHLFPLSKISKLDDARYEIDFSGYAVPRQTYRYFDPGAKEWKTVDDKAVLIFDSTEGFGDLYTFQRYVTGYTSSIFARLGPIAGSYSRASISGLEGGWIPYVAVEHIGNERYLWIDVQHKGFGVGNGDSGFFRKKAEVTLYP